jgi:aryl-alcohol dehydrogenase-like predicted oxidoreductase
MHYKKLGQTGIEISILSMGGHEYLSDGRSRGFNEDFNLAVTPGYIFEGFGADRRKKNLAIAFEHGINLFDVTQDSEKEALGRNLMEISPPYEIFIQTRPEGMVYTYDLYNRKMAQYNLLKAEVQRSLKLLKRDRLDLLNIAFMQSALDHDPQYLDKIKNNVERLKKEGLIRFVCADTFSGEATYLSQIESDAFDAVYINFNFADHGAIRKVFPATTEKRLGVISREAFMKGQLFHMADEIGFSERSKLAQAALKWNLSNEAVTTVVIGTNNPEHLKKNLAVLDNLEITDEDINIIESIKRSNIYQTYEKNKLSEFYGVTRNSEL